VQIARLFYMAPQSTQQKILLVSDKTDASGLLSVNLFAAGFHVIVAANGKSALAKARSEAPSLIVLDLGLSRTFGFEVCRKLKNGITTRSVPIIMLTAGNEEDRILGLELGADDCVTKPFSPRELILRIKLSLNRAKYQELTEAKMTLGDIVIDLNRHEVCIQNEVVDLTLVEFKLLAVLMEHCGSVVRRATLLDGVWGYASDAHTRTIDTHVTRLRAKLGSRAAYLETIRGIGYRLNPELNPSHLETTKVYANGFAAGFEVADVAKQEAEDGLGESFGSNGLDPLVQRQPKNVSALSV
jgi:DNA-binding response OmpR family regulator